MAFSIAYGVFLVIFYGAVFYLKLKEYQHAKRLMAVVERLEVKDKELGDSLARIRKLLKKNDTDSSSLN